MIHNRFRFIPDMKPLYGLQDYADIQWLGDDKIFEFLELWKQIVTANTIQLTPKQLATILEAKIPANSRAVGQDLAYYKRLPEDHEQKTYDYLINALERHIDRQQMETNQGLRRAALTRGRGLSIGLGAARGGGAGTPAGSGKKPCYFFNHGGCKHKDDKCKFAHVKVSAEDKEKMVKPESRSASPARSSGGGPPQPVGERVPRREQHCFKFLKGECQKGDTCMFAHVSAETLTELKRAAKAREAAPKAKAKAKAKAVAVKPVPTSWDERVAACIAAE